MTAEAGYQAVQKFGRNTKGRDWFVGDIHGEFDLLLAGLERIEFNPARDRLFCTGDLVDRGPASDKLLYFFLSRTPRWFHSVLGNHEMMLLGARRGGEDQKWVWERNQGGWADPHALPDEWFEGLESMPLALEVELQDGRLAGMVHAELPTNFSWTDIHSRKPVIEDATAQGDALVSSLLWGRKRANSALRARRKPKASKQTLLQRSSVTAELKPVEGLDLLIMGHTPMEPRLPLRISNLQWIDTGAGYWDGVLSFIEPVSGVCWQGSNLEGRYRQIPLPPALALDRWELLKEQIKRMAKTAR